MTEPKPADYRECTSHAPLADGGLVGVTAVANLRRGHGPDLAAVKVDASAKPLAAHCKEVIEQARLNEHGADERWRVTFYLEPCPAADDNGWELAAVIADRMARGLLPPARNRILALGRSDRWDLGRVRPLAGTAQAARLAALAGQLEAGDHCIVAEPDDDLARIELDALETAGAEEVQRIGHLGGLLGHPDPARASRTARAWFPLVSGDHGSNRLAWVEVTVLAGEPDSGPEAANISFPGGPPTGLADQARDVLLAARDLDGRPGRWRSSVRFGNTAFSDDSYQLALVMADRIARGRDVPAQGRFIATGRSNRWNIGRVDDVGGREEKCRLFEQEVAQGDRILVPAAWGESLPAGFVRDIERRGVSVGMVKRLG